MCIACSPMLSLVTAATSRRGFLRGAGALTLATGFAAAGSRFACSAVVDTADVIYVGGPILTMVDSRPQVEAVLVRSGRIAATGSRTEIEPQAGAGARVIDLAGKTLLPGFFDAHSHVQMVGLQALAANALSPPDGEANDIPSLVHIVKDWASRNEAAIARYHLIIGFGYDESQLREQRAPTRADLDQVSTDIPVVIVHASGHLGALNSKALEVAGYTAATPDPDGGVIRRRDGSREPNGVLEEAAFFGSLEKLLAKLDAAAGLAMIKAGTEAAASYGYTTAQEGRATAVVVAMERAAAEQGLLAIDVVAYPDIVSTPEAVVPSRDYRNRYRIGGAKLTIDRVAARQDSVADQALSDAAGRTTRVLRGIFRDHGCAGEGKDR
jgi:predicted amidohydrolase YtcJ